MKYMNVKERYTPLNLQLFVEEGDGGDEAGGGDDLDGEEDLDEDGEEDKEEKKFSQKDMDDAVKKRIAREKRRWQREQQKPPNPKPKDGKPNEQEEDKETTELRERAQKAEDLELKWTCLEHDVDKTCVDDVLALARVKVSKDKDLDIEDAIDDVLKKYPQFKSSYKEDEDSEEKPTGKSWGQRQNGRRQKATGVEDAFLKKNPGLKID